MGEGSEWLLSWLSSCQLLPPHLPNFPPLDQPPSPPLPSPLLSSPPLSSLPLSSPLPCRLFETFDLVMDYDFNALGDLVKGLCDIVRGFVR
jgi:hypothetical protein